MALPRQAVGLPMEGRRRDQAIVPPPRCRSHGRAAAAGTGQEPGDPDTHDRRHEWRECDRSTAGAAASARGARRKLTRRVASCMATTRVPLTRSWTAAHPLRRRIVANRSASTMRGATFALKPVDPAGRRPMATGAPASRMPARKVAVRMATRATGAGAPLTETTRNMVVPLRRCLLHGSDGFGGEGYRRRACTR